MVEPDEAAREPIAADGLAGGERQFARLQAGEIGEGLFGGRGAGENALRLDEERPPGGRQRDAPADAIKQFDVVALFERGDRRARRRLCQVQHACRARHVLAFGDGDENAQLLQRHRPTSRDQTHH